MHTHLKKAAVGALAATTAAFGVMAAPASAHDGWDGRRGDRSGEVRQDGHERHERQRHDRRDWDRRDWDRHERRDRDGHDRRDWKGDRPSEDDLAFLGTAAGIALSEIHQGNIAMQRGTNPLVQEYGRQMVVDHFVQLVEQLPLLREHEFALPVLSEEQLAALTELTSTPDESFDGVYVGLQISGHESAIEVFAAAADGADSRKVRTFAAGQLPVLQMHLDAAHVIADVVEAPEPVA